MYPIESPRWHREGINNFEVRIDVDVCDVEVVGGAKVGRGGRRGAGGGVGMLGVVGVGCVDFVCV